MVDACQFQSGGNLGRGQSAVYNVIKHVMAVMAALTPLTVKAVRSIRVHHGTTMVV